MNLEKLFKAQKELDDRIVEEKGLQGKDLLDKKILALQVELGELANEWRGFKFWSDNQKPKPMSMVIGQHPLLEEYVDVIHFAISIGLEIGIKDRTFSDTIETLSLTSQFQVVFDRISTLRFRLYPIEQGKGDVAYYNLVRSILGLGEKLGFTWAEIEQAYFEKNKINHQRQDDNY